MPRAQLRRHTYIHTHTHAGPIDPELEERKVALFKEYLIAQEDEGFNGTFRQYLHMVDAHDITEVRRAVNTHTCTCSPSQHTPQERADQPFCTQLEALGFPVCLLMCACVRVSVCSVGRLVRTYPSRSSSSILLRTSHLGERARGCLHT